MAFFHGFDDKIQKDAFGCYGHKKIRVLHEQGIL